MFVRGYDGGVVQAADAARLVVPMPESGDETGLPLEPEAYRPAAPTVYRYAQQLAGRDHVGLVCAMTVAAFADGRVRGHEAVLPERVAALEAHLEREPGGLELVTTVHAAGPAFQDVLAADLGAPLVDVETADGAQHTVWAVPESAAVLEELSSIRHYLADGHHRVAATINRWVRAGMPDDRTLAVVCYALDGLDLGPHRRADGDPAVEVPTLAEVIATADARLVVPPKTTAFRPKPASGLFRTLP